VGEKRVRIGKKSRQARYTQDIGNGTGRNIDELSCGLEFFGGAAWVVCCCIPGLPRRRCATGEDARIAICRIQATAGEQQKSLVLIVRE
jgi:hypothetical protein